MPHPRNELVDGAVADIARQQTWEHPAEPPLERIARGFDILAARSGPAVPGDPPRGRHSLLRNLHRPDPRGRRDRVAMGFDADDQGRAGREAVGIEFRLPRRSRLGHEAGCELRGSAGTLGLLPDEDLDPDKVGKVIGIRLAKRGHLVAAESHLCEVRPGSHLLASWSMTEQRPRPGCRGYVALELVQLEGCSGRVI